MVTGAKKRTVLIIEDITGYRRIYQDALEAGGYNVIDEYSTLVSEAHPSQACKGGFSILSYNLFLHQG